MDDFHALDRKKNPFVFNPFPPVAVEMLRIMEKRCENMSLLFQSYGNDLITSILHCLLRTLGP